MSDTETTEVVEPEPVEPEGSTEGETDDELVPVSKLRELRTENKTYRERWQPYERAFSEFSDEDRDFILSWLPTYVSNPDEFVATTRTILENLNALTPEQEAQVAEDVEAAEAAAEDKGEVLTPEKVEEIVAARLEAERKSAAEQAEQAKAVEAIYAQVVDAGFEQGTPAFRDVLYRMAHETEGDLDAAVKAHKDYQQSIIDGFVESKNAPTPPPAGGEAPAPVKDEPRNVKDAHKAALAAMHAQ